MMRRLEKIFVECVVVFWLGAAWIENSRVSVVLCGFLGCVKIYYYSNFFCCYLNDDAVLNKTIFFSRQQGQQFL